MPPTLPNTLTNGTTADAAQVMANFNAINAAVDQATVTSLPGSPYDGQEIYYLADATNGIVWHLKYRAASASAYKWECVGGASLRAFVSAVENLANGGGWTNLTTSGPSVTAPLAGDYSVKVAHYFRHGDASGIGYAGVGVGGASPPTSSYGADTNTYGEANGVANHPGVTLTREWLITAVVAANALKMMYQAGGSASVGVFGGRSLVVVPVRVG